MVESAALLRQRTGHCSEGSNPSLSAWLCAYAPVAQLDRVQDYESWGRAFESLRVRFLQGMLA